MAEQPSSGGGQNARDTRLRRHADYQRVYQNSRKQSSSSMTYFFRLRSAEEPQAPAQGARVGLTAGRVLGKAHDRNRIKRRMREAVRRHIAALPANVDVVLHPRRSVLTMEFARLEQEVGRIFTQVRTMAAKAAASPPRDAPPATEKPSS